jgi:acetyltransferase-like isoleucine patch superfamily enzyme
MYYSIIDFVSRIKKAYYKRYNRILFSLNGVKYGKNLCVFNKFYISTKGKVSIGDNVKFISGDFNNPITRNIMGCLYSEPKSVIIIGNRVGVSPSCIWIKEKLEIGSNVMIGANCLIMDNDAHQIDYEARFHGKKANPLEPTTIVQHAPIIIEDDVWIGANCQILKGVTIGARTIIGAGSVVTRNIPADCIAAGNPCRIIRRNG